MFCMSTDIKNILFGVLNVLILGLILNLNLVKIKNT